MLRRFSPLSSWRKRSYCSSMYSKMAPKLFELSMASPKPGVSTTVRRSLTPRSSISTVEASSLTVCFCFSTEKIDYWSVRNVYRELSSSPMASGIMRSGYRSVRNRLFTSVDLPSPDSPTTIRVNSKPFFTDLRCTWLGRLAKPTYPGVSMLENCK